MQSSFTPGPWFVPTPIYRTFYVEARVGNGMLQEVASCGPTADPAQQAANARLIAAAPELLEALRRVMDIDQPIIGNPTHAQLVEYWEYEKSQGRGEADDRLFALAAIAKATGGDA